MKQSTIKDNYMVRFGPDGCRKQLEVYSLREATVVKQAAQEALGANAEVTVTRMIYAVMVKEPEGTTDRVWDFAYTREALTNGTGLVWSAPKFPGKEYYYKYLPRTQLDVQLGM